MKLASKACSYLVDSSVYKKANLTLFALVSHIIMYFSIRISMSSIQSIVSIPLLFSTLIYRASILMYWSCWSNGRNLNGFGL